MTYTQNGVGSNLVNKKVTVPHSLIRQQMHSVKRQRISLIESETIIATKVSKCLQNTGVSLWSQNKGLEYLRVTSLMENVKGLVSSNNSCTGDLK
jgi:hypothetical protein